MLRTTLLIGLLASLVIQSGCGGSSPFDTVPVTGKVQLADGKTLTGYAMKSIRFTPVSTDPESRVATAEVKEDGTFSLGTLKTGDGALPGKYTVGMTILKNYPPALAEARLVWDCQPSEVEVKEDMEPLVITVKPVK